MLRLVALGSKYYQICHINIIFLYIIIYKKYQIFFIYIIIYKIYILYYINITKPVLMITIIPTMVAPCSSFLITSRM